MKNSKNLQSSFTSDINNHQKLHVNIWQINKICTFKMNQMKDMLYFTVAFKFHKEWYLDAP